MNDGRYDHISFFNNIGWEEAKYGLKLDRVREYAVTEKEYRLLESIGIRMICKEMNVGSKSASNPFSKFCIILTDVRTKKMKKLLQR